MDFNLYTLPESTQPWLYSLVFVIDISALEHFILLLITFLTITFYLFIYLILPNNIDFFTWKY
jgi:hypothetical protein